MDGMGINRAADPFHAHETCIDRLRLESHRLFGVLPLV